MTPAISGLAALAVRAFDGTDGLPTRHHFLRFGAAAVLAVALLLY
jgi:hypothetical protein